MKYADYCQRFAEKIIEAIRAGTAPWQRPWKAGDGVLGFPVNISSKRPYRGVNALYLMAVASEKGYTDDRWGTYRQIKKAGGHVRRGETGEVVIYWSRTKRVLERDEDGKPKRDSNGRKVYRESTRDFPLLRHFYVFNVEQTEGIETAADSLGAEGPGWDSHDLAEAVIETSGITVKTGTRAAYSPRTDVVTLPPRDRFETADGFYATAMHELAHATGHKNRLDREMSTLFGTPTYAKEELRAEIAAMMIGSRIGIGHTPQNGAAYIEGWIKALEEDPREIYRASADAQKITDYLVEPAEKAMRGEEEDKAA